MKSQCYDSQVILQFETHVPKHIIEPQHIFPTIVIWSAYLTNIIEAKAFPMSYIIPHYSNYISV